MIDFRKHLALKLENPDFKMGRNAKSPSGRPCAASLRFVSRGGVTQKEPAEGGGFKLLSLRRLENSNSNTSVETLEKITGRLGQNPRVSFALRLTGRLPFARLVNHSCVSRDNPTGRSAPRQSTCRHRRGRLFHT